MNSGFTLSAGSGKQLMERRVDELRYRLVLHQLETTNTIEPAEAVKTAEA